MIVAVTYQDGKVYEHFGHATQIKFYDISLHGIEETKIVEPKENGHYAMAELLSAYHTQVLICGNIGDGAKQELSQREILLYGGVSGDADAAVLALIQDSLQYNENAGCSGEGHSCGSCSCDGGCHGCCS